MNLSGLYTFCFGKIIYWFNFLIDIGLFLLFVVWILSFCAFRNLFKNMKATPKPNFKAHFRLSPLPVTIASLVQASAWLIALCFGSVLLDDLLCAKMGELYYRGHFLSFHCYKCWENLDIYMAIRKWMNFGGQQLSRMKTLYLKIFYLDW